MSSSPGSSQGSTGSSTVGGHVLSLDFSKQNFQMSPASLVLLVAPETHFRFRYDTEMSGTHGSLQSDRGAREKQIPTVRLVGYSGPAVVRVSLSTCNDSARYPHPHHLFVREKLYFRRRYQNLDGKELYKKAHYMDPHYIVISDSHYIGKFEGMSIISSKKEHFQRVIKEKLVQRGLKDEELLDNYVQEALTHVDIACVSLCFEAFRFDDGVIGDPICPPLYSAPIANAKNANSGKLKITKINTCSGSCRGGDSIWLLVEKINKKGLVVRFYEHAADGSLIWESTVEGDKLELHYQYAVIFQTPPYRDENITRAVNVSMRLERRVAPIDCSEPETFVYVPFKETSPCKISTREDNIYRKESMFTAGTPIKRPLADHIPPYTVPNKRRNEEFSSSDSFDLFRFNQQRNKEFQAILMDLYQLDGVVERDGPVDDRQQVLLRVLKALMARAQLRDGDVKAVTEKIGRLFLRSDDLKLQDAASTLLSLRSGGVSMHAVHEAVAAGDVSALEMALQSGGNADELNEENKTPLHVAVERGDAACTELLLEQKTAGDWINARDKNGLTALHIAVSKKDVGAVAKIIAAGGDVNFDNAVTGQSTLQMAVETKHPVLIRCVTDKLKVGHSRNVLSAPLALSSSRLTFNSSPSADECKPKGVIEKIAEILNHSGKWENMAILWEAEDVVKEAAAAENPAMCLFSRIQEKQGLDLDDVRNLLDALDEKDAVTVIDETLAKRFL